LNIFRFRHIDNRFFAHARLPSRLTLALDSHAAFAIIFSFATPYASFAISPP